MGMVMGMGMGMGEYDDHERNISNGKEMYQVYFRDSSEELKFRGNQLRVHQEWIHGSNWIVSSLPKTPNLEIIPAKVTPSDLPAPKAAENREEEEEDRLIIGLKRKTSIRRKKRNRPEIAPPQEISDDQIHTTTTRVLSVKEAMEIRMSMISQSLNEIAEKDIAKEVDDTLLSQLKKGDLSHSVCPNSEAKLLLLPGTWSEFEASKERLSNSPGYVNENVGTSFKSKTVVYHRRKAVPSSQPEELVDNAEKFSHQDVNEDVPIVQQQQPNGTVILNTTPLSESPKSCCAANVNVHGLGDSKDLNMTTYHSVLDAFYRKGGHSWEDDLVLSHLRSVLDIANDDHLRQLKLMTSRSSH